MLSLLSDILATFYLFLPAYVANSTPVLAAHFNILPKLNRSIDFGHRFRGKRIFGDHKTVRGFVVGVSLGMLIAVLQHWLLVNDLVNQDFLIFPRYHSLSNSIILAFLMGFGALTGDALKSFIKRQVGIEPGSTMLFADQLDYIIGSLAFIFLVFSIPFKNIAIYVGTGFILHILSGIFSQATGMKKSWI